MTLKLVFSFYWLKLISQKHKVGWDTFVSSTSHRFFLDPKELTFLNANSAGLCLSSYIVHLLISMENFQCDSVFTDCDRSPKALEQKNFDWSLVLFSSEKRKDKTEERRWKECWSKLLVNILQSEIKSWGDRISDQKKQLESICMAQTMTRNLLKKLHQQSLKFWVD